MRVTKNELIENVKAKLHHLRSYHRNTYMAYLLADTEEARNDARTDLADLHEDLARTQKKLESLQS